MHAFKSLGALAVLAAPAVLAQAKFDYGTPSASYFGVKGRNANGPTNPDTPQLGTPINQTSVSRLASVNSIDDWCTFAPPNGEPVANVEGETVAVCTKARNNARVFPDGTITATQFIKTPLYVQVFALGDFTKIGFQAGDTGGELDPHGATNMGNPVGGNVTSNVSGKDVFYEEWMNFVAADQICMRVCIAGSDEAPPALECLHTLDEMGCTFVMASTFPAEGVFESCDGDAAYPPGAYPMNGYTSSFQQYFSSVFTAPDGGVQTFVNASPDQVTPTAPFSVASTSNCKPTSTIANGIAAILPTSAVPSASSSAASSAAGASSGASLSTSRARPTSSSVPVTTSGSSSGAAFVAPNMALASLAAALGAAVLAAVAVI